MLFDKCRPIAIIDSGIGGLKLCKKLHLILKNENLIYFADKAFMPYGNKKKSIIINRLKKITDYLIKTFNVKMVVLACNTATTVAESCLKTTYKKIKIFGVRPDLYVAKKVGSGMSKIEYVDDIINKDGKEKAYNKDNTYIKDKLLSSKNNSVIEQIDNIPVVNKQANISNKIEMSINKSKVLIICTKLTAKYLKHQESIDSQNVSNLIAIPKLASIIEDEYFNKKKLINVIKKIGFKYNFTNYEYIILGCTHYELVYDIFKSLFPNNHFIMPSNITVNNINTFISSKTYNINQKNDLSNVYFISSLESKSYVDKLNYIFNQLNKNDNNYA